MLISISPDVVESLNNNDLDQSIVNYLTNSLSQIIETNENMIVFSENPKAKDSYYQFLDNDNISTRLREIIKFLSNQYMYTSNIFDYVNRYIEITVNHTEWCESYGDGILYLGLDYIYNNELKLQVPIKILGENDSDSKFFKDLGELYKKYLDELESSNMYYDTLKYKIGSGGGGTIDTRIVTEVYTNKEITVAIADSDIKYDGGEFGTTAQNLNSGKQELIENHSMYHFEAIILKVHEKENLIKPSEYLRMGLDTQYINNYRDIENDENLIKYLKYLDYKSGMNKYYNKLSDDKKSEYDIYYSDLEKVFPHYKQFNLERTCFSVVDTLSLDLNLPDDIVTIRKELSKIFWSWGISKNSQHLSYS
ncbi:hypothetical protein [Streptococcus australis]|jgi:hypothetical protein|uniref:hypothetical protein n=1 Tax=Streptococcus australis TaxID=113107 RepID=UPI0039C2CC65